MNFKPFLALLLFCFSLKAQQNKVDSLKKLIAVDKEDTLKVKHLTQLSWAQKNMSNYKEALEIAQQGLQLSVKLNHKKGIGDAYNLNGVVYWSQGDTRTAIDYYVKALEIRTEIGDKIGLAGVYNNLGLIYQVLGDRGKSLENFMASVKLNRETGNKNWLSSNYNNIGGLYADQGKHDIALENYLIAKKIKEEIGETRDRQYANIVGNIADNYAYRKDYRRALEMHKSSQQIRMGIGDKNGMSASYISIGSILFDLMVSETDMLKRKEIFTETLENFSKAKKLSEELEDMDGLAVSMIDIGLLYLKQDSSARARTELMQALSLTKEVGSNDMISEVYQLLARCDSIDGNWKSAYEYQSLFKRYSDSLFSEENSRKMAEMSTRFETEKKEERIGQLESDKKRTRLFVIVSSLLLLGLLILGIRAYNNKRKLARLMSAESEHKEVLLQEVQHRINNNLQIMSSLLLLQANSAEDEKLHEYLKQSQNRIQSLSTMHELLYQTKSPLKINMREYLNRVLDFHKDVLDTLPGSVEMITDVADENFATSVSVPLALIVNELVTNSIKYAFTSNESGYIKVSLLRDEKSDGKWLLKVADSGKGLPDDDAYRKSSLGLRLVNIMTKQIKGTLISTNSPGATFEISFNLAA